MTPNPVFAPGGPHWQFALDFHARPGVAEACVVLQDALDLDVVLLLFALYAAQHGRLFDAAQLAEADALLAPWRLQVIAPLRALRRQMKQAALGVPADAAESVRMHVKEAELRAEQASLALLAQRFAVPEHAAPADALAEVPERTAAFYAARCGVRQPHDGWPPHVQEALRTLRQAAQLPAAVPAAPFKASPSRP